MVPYKKCARSPTLRHPSRAPSDTRLHRSRQVASAGAAGAHVREPSEILGARSTDAPGKSGRRSRTRDGRLASLAATRSQPLQHRFASALEEGDAIARNLAREHALALLLP
ncbi:hypothetical protein MTO96_022015 [Rhipicephalus appendiculatus]